MTTTAGFAGAMRAGPKTAGGGLVVAYLAGVFLLVNFALPHSPPFLSVYVIQPGVWLGLATLCLNLNPGLLKTRGRALLAGAAAGLFHVSVFALAGLVYGFGYSTFAHGPIAIISNLVYLGSMLCALECARAYLLREWQARAGPGLSCRDDADGARDDSLRPARGRPRRRAARVRDRGRALLPATAESALATLLALAGGPWAALAYRGVVHVSEWMSPLQPDLTWLLAVLAGTLAPGLALLAVHSMVETPEVEASDRRSVPSWAIVFSLTIAAVIWLNTGLLGVRPALVSGVSMAPHLVLGDIVVTREVDPATLRSGDIIRFRSGEVPVLHRITAIERAPEGLVFTTQGDNNNLPDGPVPEALVEGKVILTIPKLGLLPIGVRNWLAR